MDEDFGDDIEGKVDMQRFEIQNLKARIQLNETVLKETTESLFQKIDQSSQVQKDILG